MLISNVIFTHTSAAPLLAIWQQLKTTVGAAYNHRNYDIEGEFAAMSNALQIIAHNNATTLGQMRPTKKNQQTHEAVCMQNVKETYNDFLKKHNLQHRTNAVALGSLWTCPIEDVVAHPGKPNGSTDSLTYALDLAIFNQQYWASALGFLYYLREVLNLSDASDFLSGVAQTIEDRYLAPLQKNATQQWLTLLVIGGSAADLQLARERLAALYVNGTYNTSTFLSTSMSSDQQHSMSKQLKNAFFQAMSHPRSDPVEPVVSILDLGL